LEEDEGGGVDEEFQLDSEVTGCGGDDAFIFSFFTLLLLTLLFEVGGAFEVEFDAVFEEEGGEVVFPLGG